MSGDVHIPEDGDIIERILAGEVDAFELMLVRYREYVFGIVMKHVPENDVEEVAHDVFVRAYQSLPTYKYKGAFKYWLSRITVRTCYDYWRNRYRVHEQPFSTLDERQINWVKRYTQISHNAAQEKMTSSCEARELLEWAMDRLSPEDRMVLELIHIEMYPVKEAANMLGWSAANVKVRAFRARRKLRKTLDTLVGHQGGIR